MKKSYYIVCPLCKKRIVRGKCGVLIYDGAYVCPSCGVCFFPVAPSPTEGEKTLSVTQKEEE